MAAKTEFKVTPSDPERLGMYSFRADEARDGNLFACTIPEGSQAELLLYHAGDALPCQIIPLEEKDRVGNAGAVFVEMEHSGDYEYNYRIDGKIMPDPYARAVRTVQNQETGAREYRCSMCVYDRPKTEPLGIPYEDCIFYKLHVRGFTKGRPGIRHPGTFLGLIDAIPYLKELGVTSLILMPPYTFEEETDTEQFYYLDQNVQVMQPEKEGGLLNNYWGYTKGLYFAPKASYCATANPNRELAEMVDALHHAGLECIPEFYFLPEADARLVTDVLRYWRLHFKVDGFHLVGEGGWKHAVLTDPLLCRTKLIASGFDTSICRKREEKYRNLGSMNPGYEQLMRRFLKGDLDVSTDDVGWFLRRNFEDQAVINYFADQDGFTMYDMVSYEEKHNDANGEQNHDGTSYNFTWNCGEEGPSRKGSVRQLRRNQLRNAFLMLMTSQGCPMIYAGDEVENTQNGNNNAWCQDNRTGWVTWSRSRTAREMQDFVKTAIRFRREHPVLHSASALRMTDYKACGFPDLSYHGAVAWMHTAGETRIGIGALYCGSYAVREDGSCDDTIYIIYNMYWMVQKFALPDLPDGCRWVLKADTSREKPFLEDGQEEEIVPDTKTIEAEPRSVKILMAVHGK
ncbi:MAG: Type II secretory pathway, pullulanase PulA and related glycosidase [Eubacterium sp.]|nr:Type II secretory pathway, pullulanase PulA and related glycosidase [Eubacterium sp.]